MMEVVVDRIRDWFLGLLLGALGLLSEVVRFLAVRQWLVLLQVRISRR